MNNMFTAFTLPRMVSGVENCTSAPRMYPLTMSAAPATRSAANDSQNSVDSANTRLATPNTATAMNMVRPTLWLNGRMLRYSPALTSPTAMALRSAPRPAGPTCSTSCA
ncbi:hypothetical protein D3C71_1664800 [compost metagenome]